MANTSKLTTKIEDEVRQRLKEKFHVAFTKQKLVVGRKTDGKKSVHEFDAVSKSGKIVASIKANSWTTSGGGVPQAKISSFYAELHFFSLLKGKAKKLFIFTNLKTYHGFKKVADGKIQKDVKLVYIPLREYTRKVVRKVNKNASMEMGVKR